MKDKLILKALVCSAFMCSLSVGTMAADVSTDVKGGDTEQSSWMDRTDIGIGLGYKVLRKILIMIMQCLINK